MTLKQNFADQLKAQSDIWRAQCKDYQERLEQAGEQASVEYKETMEQMETKIQDVAKLAEQVRSANETAWKDMVTASRKSSCRASAGLGGGCLALSVMFATACLQHRWHLKSEVRLVSIAIVHCSGVMRRNTASQVSPAFWRKTSTSPRFALTRRTGGGARWQ